MSPASSSSCSSPSPTFPSSSESEAQESQEVITGTRPAFSRTTAQSGFPPPQPKNQIRRIRLGGPSLFAWSYTFQRPSAPLEFQSFGLEIGVMISGRRTFESKSRGREQYGANQVSVYNLGDQYTTEYEPPTANDDDAGADFCGEAGREVGVLVRGHHLDGWARSDDEIISFPRRLDAIADARMLNLGVAIANSIDLGDDLQGASSEAIELEVKSFIERYGDLVKIDRLERARLDLVRHFDKPLYMRHFAEIAGVHEETFARKFSARYGVTPARYRMLVRLKEAALTIATRPDLAVRDIAKGVGFEDPAYFHRAFAAYFKKTPMQFGRNFADPIAA